MLAGKPVKFLKRFPAGVFENVSVVVHVELRRFLRNQTNNWPGIANI